MDTNVQALKNLYVALGGDASDVENLTTSSEVITAMESVAASAASELPVVKKVDEGKTLTVDGNGKWAAILPESVIDDEEASETKTYSSSKIASLIPANELPAVTASDNGKLLGVNQGAWSAVEKDTIVIPCEVNNAKVEPMSDAPLRNQDEIFNAITSGKGIVMVVKADTDHMDIYRLSNYTISGKVYNLLACIPSSTNVIVKQISGSGWISGTFSSSITTFTLTPPTVPEA